MLIFGILLVLGNALFENSYTVKHINKLVDFQNVLESEFVSMVFFYSEDCENCVRASALVEKVADDQEGIINTFGANCDELAKDGNAVERIPYCENLDQLPQISYFEPPKQKINPYTQQPMIATEHRFSGEASPQSLGEFGHKYIPNHIIKINSMAEYEKFEKSDAQHNKILLFTKKKQTAAIFKALGLQYYERIKFGEIVKSPETQELLDEFEISDLPQIVALENNGDNTYNRELFDGDLTFKPIKKFLRGLAIKERIPFEQVVEQKEEPRIRHHKEEEQESVQKQVIQELTSSLLNKSLLRNEKPALVHVYKDSAHPGWEEVQKKYKNIFDYYTLMVKDEQSEELAKELQIKSYPSIKFFQVGNVGRKKSTKIAFTKDQSVSEIHKDILELIDDKTININEQTLQMQLSQQISDNKIVVMYFYDTQTIGLTYRVLSQLSEYYQKYKFLSFKNAPEQVIQHFQITTQPSLTIIFRDVKDKKELEEELKPEQVRQALFTGKMNYDEVKHFFDSFDEEKKTSGKKVIEVSTQAELQEYCHKKQKLCYIALLNGQHKNVKHNEILSRWDHQLEIFDRIKNIHGQKAANFIYIDASCHDELLLKLDISDDTLPNFIAYNSQRNQYSKLIGVFDYESLNRFIEKHFKSQTNVIAIKDLIIEEKDCDLVYQQRQQSQYNSGMSDLDDEILKEILEEEKKKKEQLKKELKKEKKNKKNKNKSNDDL